MNDWPEAIAQYFKTEYVDYRLKKYLLFVWRYDGVVLYGNQEKESSQAIGALVSGAWLASKELSSFFPMKEGGAAFRFSFDTSNSGVYVLPVDRNEQVFIGLIYGDEVNPGQLKNVLRDVSSGLNRFLEKKKTTSKKSTTSLFNNITDSEMDHLFSNAKS